MKTSSYIPPVRKDVDPLMQRDLREIFQRLQEMARQMPEIQINARSTIDGFLLTCDPPTITGNGPAMITLAISSASQIRATLQVQDIALCKPNLNGTAAPTAFDDSGKGYSVGSIWINQTASPDTVYMCTNSTLGGATWIQLG